MPTIHDYRNKLEHYWSQSRINLFLTCSLKFAYTYVFRLEPEHVPSSLVFGSAIHNCLTMMALHQKQGHPLTGRESQDLFSTSWQRALLDEKNVRFKEDETGDSLLEKGRKMMEVFHSHMPGDGDEIVSVGEAIAAPVIDHSGNVLAEPLIGELDLLVSKQDGSRVICDWKTASRKKTDHVNPADNADIQVTALTYAYRQQYGTVPEFEYHVVTKAVNPAFQLVKARATDSAMTRLLEIIKGISKAVKSECFLPADNGCWACNDCQYISSCRKWSTEQAKLISVPGKAAA